jgi:glutaredoxin-like protein
MILSDKIKNDLIESFKSLNKPVNLKYFTQENECLYCKETRELLSEVKESSDKIRLEIFDFVKDQSKAESYGVDKIPAIIVMDERDYGIKFYGIPAGYEFGSLVEAIKMVSTGETSLQSETKKFLDKLNKDVHLQVFVTPTCPFCPGAVILAHKIAYYCLRIKADMVEATEFPHLAQKYSVMGVPKTVINETEFLEGAAPETNIIEILKKIT